MLRLRQLYLETSQSENRLIALLVKSTSSFLVLFRALLSLQGTTAIPDSTDEILAGLTRLGLGMEAFREVREIQQRQTAPTPTEIDALFRRYLLEIEAVVRFVDKTISV